MAAAEANSSSMGHDGRTLLEALEFWSKKTPDKTLYTFLDDNGKEVGSITYQGLADKSAALAQHLLLPVRQKGVGMSVGDRALIVYPPSLDFIIAFYACLRAGIIAVPVFPPDPRRAKKDLYMFTAIQAASGATVALTNETYNFHKKVAGIKSFLGSSTSAWPDISWVVTDAVLKTAGASAAPASPTGALAGIFNMQKDLSAPAFLQFTSGSTSDPKGVIITHGNLAHNLEIIIANLKAGDDTVVVSWLPLYHDMGLIGSWLGAMFCGGSGYYMSPVTFIRNPPLWVELISKYRATHMQAPNFAYGLVARKFRAQRPQPVLDLSCVKHMINAAEPVRVVDMEDFYATFEASGLPRGVIYPTYGLAEHTVFVCSNGQQVLTVDKEALEAQRKVVPVSAGGGSSMEVVGCGFPAQASKVQVVIVDSDNSSGQDGSSQVAAALPEDTVGEIWVRSPSRATGYWGLAEKSKEDFGGILDMSTDGFVQVPQGAGEGQGFLRTGDLGFMHGGELFICGRMKDLIIIRGRNVYPQDLERTAEDLLPGVLRGGCSAAFSVTTKQGDEAVHIIAEVADSSKIDAAEVMSSIRQACNKAHGVSLSGVHLLEPRTVPKTSSGKIARQRCKRSLLEGSLTMVKDGDWFDSSMAAQPSTEAAEGGDDNDEVKEPQDQPGPALVGQVSTMSDDEILEIVLETVAVDVLKMTKDEFRDQVDRPIPELGLDSMEGMQMLTLLEKKLGSTIPPDILFEDETTLNALIPVIKGGVQIAQRTKVIDCSMLVKNDIKNQTDKERLTKVSKFTKQASWQTGQLPEGALTAVSDLNKKDEADAKALLTTALQSTLALPSVTVLMAAEVAIIALCLGPLHFKLPEDKIAVVGITVTALLLLYLLPLLLRQSLQSTLASKGRDSKSRMGLVNWFSCKIVHEEPLDSGDKYLVVSRPLTPPAGRDRKDMAESAALGALTAHVVANSMHKVSFGFSSEPALMFSAQDLNGCRLPSFMLPPLQALATLLGAMAPKEAGGPTAGTVDGAASLESVQAALRRGSSVVWMCEGQGTGLKEVVAVAMQSNAVLLPCYATATSVSGGKAGKGTEPVQVLGKANLSGLPCVPVLSSPERSCASVIYGPAVVVPHTSQPHPALVARHEEELLDHFKAMETQFTPLL